MTKAITEHAKADWAGQIKTAVDRFTTTDELHDDMTLLLLRRPASPNAQ